MPTERNNSRLPGQGPYSKARASSRLRGGSADSSNRGARGGRGGNGGRGRRPQSSRQPRQRGRRQQDDGFVEYTPPVYSPEASVYFAGGSPWTASAEPRDEIDTAILDAPRETPIQQIRFGEEFSIRDRHLQLLIERPALMANLQWLQLGDSDTGNGSQLTDSAVQAFVAAAPNLRVLMLDSCTSLTDAALTRAFECCAHLERVRISGNDRRTGAVGGPALRDLKTRTELAPGLKELVLLDQQVRGADIKALTSARKGLVVKTGETVGDSIADQMVAALTGGGSMLTYFGGKIRTARGSRSSIG